MRKYSVYCSFFGKKVRYDVFADSEESAIRSTRLKIVIDKVTCDEPSRKMTKDEVLSDLGKKMGVDFSDIFK